MLKNAVFKFLLNSIYKKLVFSVMLFIITPIILLAAYTFQYFEDILMQNSVNSILNNMVVVSQNLNKTVEKMMTTAQYIRQSKEVKNTLELQEDDNEKQNLVYSTSLMLSSIKMSYLDRLYNITIVPTQGDIISTWQMHYVDYSFFRKEKWFETVLKNGERFVWIVPQQQFIKYGEGSDDKNLITVAVNIFGTTNNNLGMVLISIGEETFYKDFFPEMAGLEGNMFLIDEHGTIISHFNKDYINRNVDVYNIDLNRFEKEKGYIRLNLEGQEVIASYLSLDRTGWRIVQMIPYSSLIAKTKILIEKVLRISVVLLFLILAFLFVFSSRITLPLRRLVKLMGKVEKGNMEVEIQWNGTDEISRLGDAFNKMMLEQKALILRITEEERMLAEEQRKKDGYKLEMLMAQINPHFLFNTLNTVKWMAIMGANNTVVEMISNLGKLLEISINRGNDIVTLKQEVENVRSYIYIQKIRFNGSFLEEYYIPEELQSCLVPKFILQPLVENSIVHGMEFMEAGGIMKIRASSSEGILTIDVEDNGRGISQELIDNFMKKDKNNDKKRFSGIGLGNVEERIKLYYGEEYGLTIDSHMNTGTRIVITMPLLRDNQVACQEERQ